MRTLHLALIQFDAKPEQADANRNRMASLAREAAGRGARWILFHEGTVCDYTPRLPELAEAVPDGPSTAAMLDCARAHDVFISFGLSEADHGRIFITQAFVGPAGFLYRYRKTWLWRRPDDAGYRNEWARYDPGTGPELFELDGVRATCFICADGEAPRCIARARDLKPEVVFYPNNRGNLPDFVAFGRLAREIGAPMLVTNRTGRSWIHECEGGNVLYSASGEVLARANREGREEILRCDLTIRPRLTRPPRPGRARPGSG